MTEIDIKKACKAVDASPSMKRKVHHAMYILVVFMSLCFLHILFILEFCGNGLLLTSHQEESRSTLWQLREGMCHFSHEQQCFSETCIKWTPY